MAIVGVDYPNKRGPGRRFEIEICRPGEPVDLRPEPKNPADPRAIAVYSCRDIQIGYVRAEQAALLAKRLRVFPTKAAFQGSMPWGAAVRVSFDGIEPSIPEPQESNVNATVDDDFYPDPDWPDEFSA